MLGVIKGGMRANETSSYSSYRTSLEKTDQKDRDINKGEKGALYAKSKKRGNFGVLRRSFPRQGGHPTNFNVLNYIDIHTALHESIIATQVAMLSISRNIENSVRGTYYTTIRNYSISLACG